MSKLRLTLNLFIIWSVIATIFSFITYFSGRNEGRTTPFIIILTDNFYRYGLWGLLSPLIFGATKKLDFQSKTHYLRSFGIHILLAILFSSVNFIIYGIIAWFSYIRFRENSDDMWRFLQNSFLGNQYLGLLIYFLIVFASQAYLRNRKFAEEKQKASVLQAQLVQSQLQALKMQLQPHFLFNTLNSISSLVLKNPLQAQTMIAKLGDFLRLTLDFNENQMVLLSEELRFLRSYLEIEQIRFSEKLQVIFDVSDDVMNAVVPHLALQPIVENSVKHGISQMTENGKIEITARKLEDKLQLKVKDNGPGKSVSNEKNQTGLLNIKTRLKHLYGDNFSFEMDGETGEGMTVTITIPLIFDFAEVEKND
jgi:sensor histidine kinase YesM